jgi:hypothetical protein
MDLGSSVSVPLSAVSFEISRLVLESLMPSARSDEYIFFPSGSFTLRIAGFRGTRRNFLPSNTQKPHIQSLTFEASHSWCEPFRQLALLCLNSSFPDRFGDLTSVFAGVPGLFPRRPHAHISLGRSLDMVRLHVQRDEKEESTADQIWLAARLPAAATPGTTGLRPGML